MTFSKYKRLFLVLLVPLLICGFVLSLFAPFERQFFMQCEDIGGTNLCQTLGDSDSTTHKSAVARYKTPWFDLHPGSTAYVRPYQISVSPRLLKSARITKVSALNGIEPGSQARGLVSKTGYIQLGYSKDKVSVFEADRFLIYCNSLYRETTPDTYSSQCSVGEWGAIVEYVVLDEAKSNLDGLQFSIDREIDRRKSQFAFYSVLVYPLFVYLFLILSLAAFLVSKAVRFVKNG